MTVGLNGLKVANITPYGVPLPNSVEITATYPSADEADFDGTPGVAGATQWKEPVRVATTASITIATALNAGDSLDGVTLVAGDRVLVKNQGTASQNGIYIVDATPYRAGDMDDDTEVLGAVVYVVAGTTNHGTSWAVTNTGATVVDTDAINWAAFGGTGTSGGTDLGWFVVTDPTYGAVGDGTTDDTAAIQAAINAAETAGGGVVYFPNGDYKIAGALQDTGRSNAQLLLPRRHVTDGTEQITIHLLGETAPPIIPYISGSVTEPNNGPILRSTLSSGTGALIGAWGPSGSYADFSLVRVVIENLAFRMVADPTNSCVDLSHVEACELRGTVSIDAGEFSMGSVSAQSTSTSYGLKLPGNNNGASTALPGVVNVVGFYKGILVGEHTVAQNVQVWACRQAYVFPAAYHASHFTRMAYYHCQRGLVFTASKHYLTVDQLDVEHAASGTWVPVYDIDDASNYGYGHLAWHVILEVTGYDSTFTVNGASNLHRVEIGSNPYGTPSFATPSIALGTAAAAGAATTVIRSDATIAAFDSTAPVTQAFGDSPATGSAAYAARRDHVHGMPSSGGGSALLIADTHSTPIVFADLILNEAQDDFLYAD